MFYVIKKIEPHSDYTISITYTDNVTVKADFKPLLKRGGLMRPFQNPKRFLTVRIGPRGRSLIWDKTIDFCADALRKHVRNQ